MLNLRRIRRSGTFGAIAALHIGLIYMLATTDLRIAPQSKPTGLPITWLDLKHQPETASMPHIERPEVKAMPLSIAPAVKVPPSSAITEPKSAAPAQLAPLRSYVWCGALDDGKQISETAQPCNKTYLDVFKNGSLRNEPTEQEAALARKFAHDKAVAEAPVRLPCVSGVMVSLPCVAQGILNGFDFHLASYADDHEGPCDATVEGNVRCRRNKGLNTMSAADRYK